MNHRERELAAIRHEVPDRIPIDAICIENSDAVGQLLGIPAESVVDQLGMDGRILAAERYTGELPVRKGRILSHWGTEDGNDYGTTHFYPLAAAASAAEVDQYDWPDGSRFDFDQMRASLMDWPGEFALRGPYWISAPLFCTTCNLMGMEEALVKMRFEPEVFEACIEQVFNFSSTYLEHFVAAAGTKLDILYLADDFASQRGLLMNPALWKKMLKPHYEKLFAIGKRLSLPVWFHSCGDITAILPDLIEIGMNVWETVQLHALPMPAARLKQEYGRHIAFFGGVNTQALPFKTPEEVSEEVRRCIDLLGQGGGYICGPDHHLKPDVPAANALALFEAARSYAKDGYTQSRRFPVNPHS
jgi:uroporphyrinogen decarboxylase